MPNQDRPNGWTERMQPVTHDYDHTTPTITRQPQGAAQDQGQASGAPAPNVAHAGGQMPQGQPNMTKGEKYWYDECMKARQMYDRVAPLAPYVDVIAYLDSNPEAVQVVMDHMNRTSQQGTYVPDPYANVPATRNTPAPQNNQPTVNRGSMNESEMRDRLYQANMEIIKQRGIPADEADRYIQFLMNPGNLQPDELFDMYATLQNKRSGNQPASNVVPQNQQGNGSPPAAARKGEVPPMSIAGINGENSDPRNENKQETGSSRIMMDANLL